MEPTRRTYWDEPRRDALTTTVVAASDGGVVLAATILYPEGGGQLADHGAITVDGAGRAEVVDVSVDARGVITHRIVGPAPPVGATVLVTLDTRRRREHEALHSAQHLLSQAFWRRGARTVSTRLGADRCTIDLLAEGGPLPDEAALLAGEDEVNGLILDDVPVAARIVPAEELPALGLRKAPTVTEDIRVVSVADYDHTPCGGTHVPSTGRIGSVHLTQIERYKGGTRVSFHAGPRVPRKLRVASQLLQQLARPFSTGPDGIGPAIDALRRQLTETTDARDGTLAFALGAARAALPPAERGPLLVATADLTLLRALATALAAPGAPATLVGSRGERGIPVVVATVDGDAAAILRDLLAGRDGRGGGTPRRAEGWIRGEPPPARMLWDGTNFTPHAGELS